MKYFSHVFDILNILTSRPLKPETRNLHIILSKHLKHDRGIQVANFKHSI